MKGIIETMYLLAPETRNEIIDQVQRFFLDPTQTRNIIDSPQIAFLVAIFSVPYAPAMGFEFLEYKRLFPLSEIRNNFPSIAIPIHILRASSGLSPSRTVALFPENWKNKKNSIFEGEDRVYYFINKFVTRHFSITKPILESCCDKGSFPILRTATVEEIELACCNWVTMHEHFHRQGALPLPNFLHLKNSRSSAAIEELRVDLQAILALDKINTIDQRTLEVNREFILAERLLRYAVECSPTQDYDAIGTQVLFQFLDKNGGIEIKENRLSLSRACWKYVKLLSRAISSLESRAAVLQGKEGKKVFEDFSRQLGNYSTDKKKYEELPFFTHCKSLYSKINQD